MTRVRLAFYKYQGDPVNLAISKYTAMFNWKTPPYSHVELGIYQEDKWSYFSSTLRDGARGTRWISEKRLFKHEERWDVFALDVDKTLLNMLDTIDSMIPAKYDLMGLLGFVAPFGCINSRNKWYCSEACWRVLFKWKKLISPKRMYKDLKKDLVLVL